MNKERARLLKQREDESRGIDAFMAGLDWEEALRLFSTELATNRAPLAPLFAQVEISDPHAELCRVELGWWRRDEFEAAAERVRHHFATYPGTYGNVGQSYSWNRGQERALALLSEADDRGQEAVAAALLLSALRDFKDYGLGKTAGYGLSALHRLLAWALADLEKRGADPYRHPANRASLPKRGRYSDDALLDLPAMIRRLAYDAADALTEWLPVRVNINSATCR